MGNEIQPLKMSVMRINGSGQPLKRFYILCNWVLQQVDQTTYLGVMISDDLSWSPHIEYATSKANRVLDILRRNLKECPTELRESEYFSTVSSVLEYTDLYLKR